MMSFQWRSLHTSYKAGSGILDEEIGDDKDDSSDEEEDDEVQSPNNHYATARVDHPTFYNFLQRFMEHINKVSKQLDQSRLGGILLR